MPDNVHLGKDLDAAMRAIHAAYAEQLPERLREIGTTLDDCLREPHVDAHYQQLMMRLHKLAGSAGTFGFAELGHRATELEILLDMHLKETAGGTAASGTGFNAIAAGIAAMLQQAGAHNSSQLKGQGTL